MMRSKEGRTRFPTIVRLLAIVAATLTLTWTAKNFAQQNKAATAAKDALPSRTFDDELMYRRTSGPNKENNSTSDHYEFTIVQLTDLHLGEAESTSWGPAADEKSLEVVRKILWYERPDLVVLGGDQLTANDVDANATMYHDRLIKTLSDAAPPGSATRWATIMGNHDDAPLETTTRDGRVVRRTKAKTSRIDLLRFDAAHPGSLTRHDATTGRSDYVLPLRLPRNAAAATAASSPAVVVATRIFLLDSGGGSIPKEIDKAQLEHVLNDLDDSAASTPSVVFQHVPTVEFYRSRDDDERCEGMRDDGVDALDRDAGVVRTLVDRADARFLAVGHNHGNDYCCPALDDDDDETTSRRQKGSASSSSSFHVCFGRHSGYGGYGSWERGARVFRLELRERVGERDDVLLDFSWRSWVRLESGVTVSHYDPTANVWKDERRERRSGKLN